MHDYGNRVTRSCATGRIASHAEETSEEGEKDDENDPNHVQRAERVVVAVVHDCMCRKDIKGGRGEGGEEKK